MSARGSSPLADAAEAERALVADGLAIGYGAPLATGIGLSLASGTVTCLIGPNGAGKTTLMRTLLGLLPPLDGRIRIGGEDLAGLRPATLARRLAYVPQAYAGDLALSVLDLVVMGRTAHLGAFGTPAKADFERAMAALERLRIAGLARRDAGRISGGQRQLALIARALAQGAGILVMDEPTASLDLGNRLQVLDTIRDLAADGLAVLFSTHEPEQAFAIADAVAVIEPTGGFACGPAEDLLTAERLSRLYGVSLAVERTSGGRRVVGPAAPGPPSG